MKVVRELIRGTFGTKIVPKGQGESKASLFRTHWVAGRQDSKKIDEGRIV